MILWTLSGIARHIGVDPRTLSGRRRRGELPKPDHETDRGWPLWEWSTLVREGVVQGESDDPR